MDALRGSDVLFDVPEGVDPVDRDFLEQLGHAVLVCHGPTSGKLCPILSGEGCPLATGAHGIVFELDLDRPVRRAILTRYKESLGSDVPIRVAVQPGQKIKYQKPFAGLKVWTHQPVAVDLDGFAAEVEAADL